MIKYLTTHTTGKTTGGIIWVPQLPDGCAIRVKGLMVSTFAPTQDGTTTQGYVIVIKRPLADLAELVGGPGDEIERFQASLLAHVWRRNNARGSGPWVSVDDVQHVYFPFADPETCLALSVGAQGNTGFWSEVNVRVEYDRVKLPEAAYRFLLLRNSWLVTSRQPTTVLE